MRSKTVPTIFMAIIVAGLIHVSAYSQTVGFAPNTPASFSVFSLPQNNGTTVNTSADESGSCVAPNGLSLYFSSDASGTLGSKDLWVSQRATPTSAWGAPQNLGPALNTDEIENLPTLSLDGKTMFFTSTRPGGFGSSDIYMTTRTNSNDDFGWTAPVNLGAVINTVDGEIGARYFEDPTSGTAVLYFTSNRTGGLGGEDIYQSTRNANGAFNAPTNVAALNSSALDRNSDIRRDGLEILFTSNRVGGSGARDVWVSTRASVSTSWNPPVNLAAVNSTENDQTPSLSPDGSTLYVSSDRVGGGGSLDLYTATRVNINRSPTADFDGDGRTDFAVYRPSEGKWYLRQSQGGWNTISWGLATDEIVPGDYDGDGRTDPAVFRPSDGTWYIINSTSSTFTVRQWGQQGDLPVPGDYDGDGRSDLAVYRNGVWYVMGSTSGASITNWGIPGDQPVPAAN